jgi:hypothetical protein
MKRLLLLSTLLLTAFTCAARNDAIFVPLTITPSNFPLVTITIGNKQLPVMFDMGGNGQLALSAQALQGLQVEALPPADQWVDASGKKIEAKRFRVPKLQIGTAVFQDVIGYEDVEAPGYRKSPAGVGHFGAPMLRGYKVVLDYKRQEMDLVSADNASPERAGCSGIALAYLPQWQGEPVTKVGTDLGELTMVWDTGAPVSLLQRSKAGQAASNNRYHAGKFIIGSVDLGPVDFLLFDFNGPPGLDGFIGYNFLVKNVVCIDHAGKKLLVRRSM